MILHELTVGDKAGLTAAQLRLPPAGLGAAAPAETAVRPVFDTPDNRAETVAAHRAGRGSN